MFSVFNLLTTNRKLKSIVLENPALNFLSVVILILNKTFFRLNGYI